jgi:hypothetical protein
MPKPEFKEKIFFVHPHGLYIDGAQTALTGLKIISDVNGKNSTAEILTEAKISSAIPSGSLVMVFKPSPKVEFIAEKNGWKLVSVSSELNRRFEDKITSTEEFIKAGLPILPFEIIVPNQTSWKAVTDVMGARVVAQTSRGHAGSSSVVLKNGNDWQKLALERGEYKVKLTKFEDGETWTLNACVTHHGTLVSRPFLQLQKMNVCGVENELSTCGNWHKEMNAELAEKIMSHAEKFGDYLYSNGYKGWFGLDLLVRDSNLIGFIECNPRLTASIGIFTEMQVEAGQSPFIVLHTLELLGIDYSLNLLEEQKKLMRGFSESHVVLRAPYVKKSLRSGVYSDEGKFIRDECRWADLKPGELLVRTRSSGINILFGEPQAMFFSRGDVCAHLTCDKIEKYDLSNTG